MLTPDFTTIIYKNNCKNTNDKWLTICTLVNKEMKAFSIDDLNKKRMRHVMRVVVYLVILACLKHNICQ